MDRQEHLEWCKNRALVYIEAGDLNQAYASMASDMSKHSGTAGHLALGLGMQLLMIGQLSTPEAMRNFILGFN